MNKLYRLSVLMLLVLSSALFAQSYKVTGVVKSSAGDALIGANVYVQGTTTGAATDENGKYEVTLKAGKYTVVCSYIGFETISEAIDLTNNMELNFSLRDKAFSLSVEVIADRAKERETPVAFTNVDKKEMEQVLGSQDIPMVLNTTPSVYASQEGGGAGDSRISLRGFDQRNFAIMINGVPVNDMENGWVYWSNWDGVGDATSSIQIQRGLSAVNLATASIGGTLNIVTDPVAYASSFDLKQEFGSGAFRKTTMSFNTGLIDNKFALNGTLVRKVGDGINDKTWTDAYAYYFGAAYNINEKNRIEVYAIGAPQRHGQFSYEQNLAEFSHELAIDNGFSQEALDAIQENGTKWNGMWNTVDPTYGGNQAWNKSWWAPATGKQVRYASDFLNERENFFHKPIVNFNYYGQLSEKASLYTTLYWSGGIGGGTGTYGSTKSVKVGFTSVKDWDATIANNRATVDDGGLFVGKGVLRNSRNDQDSYGALAKMLYKVSDDFTMQVGVDWRTAEVEHYREVRDMLGGDYLIMKDNKLLPSAGIRVGLGDKIGYWETNNIDWLGAYLQGEYTAQRFTAVGMVGWSTVKYKTTNHFLDDGTGNPATAESEDINAIQFKGGLNYRIDADMNAFINAGWVNKVPTLDQALDDVNTLVVADPGNEKFFDVEAGLNWNGLDGRMAVSANIYYTKWQDRFMSRTVTLADDREGTVNLLGMNETHMGLELEVAYQPVDMLKFDLTVSVGDWQYDGDVASTFTDYQAGQVVQESYNLYLDGIKVGDQPQQSVVLSVSLFPIDGLYISGIVKHYREFYSMFDPATRNDPDDKGQSWKLPDFTVIDLHAAYDLPWKLGSTEIQLFAHVFNLLDALYISEGTDNSSYEGYHVGNYYKNAFNQPHTAEAGSVYLGLPMNFNAGIKIKL
ncbi:MAG: TonB-dependent receptor [Bacteroidetes bacterium]|nr:TonB-dependent receptor [Bacteroidota bacterium]